MEDFFQDYLDALDEAQGDALAMASVIQQIYEDGHEDGYADREAESTINIDAVDVMRSTLSDFMAHPDETVRRAAMSIYKRTQKLSAVDRE